MAKFKRLLSSLLVFFLMAQVSACITVVPAEAEDSTAAGTLQAVYAEQTQSALSAADETEDADATQGAPAATPQNGRGQATQQGNKPPLQKPAEVPETERTLEDSDSSIKADENRALSGDDFTENLYERPFTSREMIYQPDLDINTVDFSQDETFFYFTILLNGMNVENWILTGRYGIEFDRTLTGRGDFIVLVEKPSKKWSIANISAFADKNVDVGGPTPLIADASFEGNGYDLKIELTGNRLAFARISPDSNQAVQFAISRELLENPDQFLWGAWADNGPQDIRMFDYNDAMEKNEAGSPLNDDEDYPLKALFNIDNTCRLPYGFDQLSASYPGMCITSSPTAQPGDDDPDCYCTDPCVSGCCGEWICE